MDPTTRTIEELMYHGRWHIIGGIMFLVFFWAFIREAFRELLGVRSRRRAVPGAWGPLLTDPHLGRTMADGGEPMDGHGESAASR